MRKHLIPAMALIMFLAISACSFDNDDGSITVASKQFTENILLSEMYAQLIEYHTDLQVVRKQNIGTTAVCFTAMEKGDVDFYVEYTGTICSEILRHQHGLLLSREESYQTICVEMNDLYGITVFPAIGLSNNFALGMIRAKAESLCVASMSDLSAVSTKLVFAANDLFFTRLGDGYDAMTETYDMSFKSVVKMNNASAYDAIGDDNIDVMLVYTTDSMLQNHDILILDDDKNVFPDYYALPIVRGETLEKHPELNGILNLLENSIDNERMQELNYLVDIGGETPEEVAKAFLTELGLFKK